MGRLRIVGGLVAALLAGCGGAPARAPLPSEAQPGDPPYAVALRFDDAGTIDEEDTPRTRVLLVRIAPSGERTSQALTVEVGACYHERAPDALIGARCWWGGEGAVFELRRADDAVIALRADAEGEVVQGAPREVGRTAIPRGAELTVLSPDAM